MREILFRGKRTDTGEWVYGDLLNVGVDYYYAIRTYGGREHGQVNAVNEKTVGQYTGLTDKNGKKIFEGDIVRYGDTVHEVVFEQRYGTAYFGLVYSPLETLPCGHYQDLRQIEVIGNITDNPELLNSEREGEE